MALGRGMMLAHARQLARAGILQRGGRGAFLERASFASKAAEAAGGAAGVERPHLPSVETPFEARYRSLNREQQDALEKEYDELAKGDWRDLTLSQKRALYTVMYGAPKIKDQHEAAKVFWGTVGLFALGVGLFAGIRQMANPPPKTLTPEYKAQTEEYLRSQNMNPIFGISSKPPAGDEDLAGLMKSEGSSE